MGNLRDAHHWRGHALGVLDSGNAQRSALEPAKRRRQSGAAVVAWFGTLLVLACVEGNGAATPASADTGHGCGSAALLAAAESGRGRNRRSLSLRGGSDLVKVRFEVQVEQAQPGDSVLLMWSNSDALRRPRPYQAWDSSRDLQLTTNEVDSPWWWVEAAVPVGDTIEFNFAIRSPTGATAREPRSRRKHVIPDAPEAILSFKFGDGGTHGQQEERRLPRLVAAVLEWPYHHLPQLVASVDAIMLACRRSPALLAHLPLAVMIVWDMLKPPADYVRVRDGVYASILPLDRGRVAMQGAFP
jgi:hypothetical protein